MDYDALRSELAEKGFCSIPDVIPGDAIGPIRESIARDVRSHTDVPMPTGHVPGFLGLNQSLAPYLTDERVMRFVESVFGPHFRISMHTGTVNGSGIPRGAFHADWPYNQKSAARISAPYPDVITHLVTFWMLTDFTEENGATILVPGSHRHGDHPGPRNGIDPMKPYPGECRMLGKAGTVVAFDSRLWHAVAPNVTNEDRVAVIIRFAPWWLNLDPLRPGTIDRQNIVDATNGQNAEVPGIPLEVFERLPPQLKPLLHYSVETGPRQATRGPREYV
ncbi:MAG: phytanoyl-CoA dioxygenase family protein [Acidimicrobiia bacterium]|nr:phytanoyl-CoA dioxygenase family protein [Acidimicrobiia bacterium]